MVATPTLAPTMPVKIAGQVKQLIIRAGTYGPHAAATIEASTAARDAALIGQLAGQFVHATIDASYGRATIWATVIAVRLTRHHPDDPTVMIVELDVPVDATIGTLARIAGHEAKVTFTRAQLELPMDDAAGSGEETDVGEN